MTIFKTISLLFLLLFVSCKKEKKTNSDAVQNTISKNDTTAAENSKNSSINGKLETFGFPAEVQGCSCYFAENKTLFEKQQYLYVDDYGNSAFLKINGKTVRITMEEGDFDPSNFNKTIENEEYRVKMTGEKINELDETMMFKGQMIVENKKTGEKITTPIFGECGC